MTEREICASYREAKNQYAQIQVLADLNCIERKDVVKILVRNGEKVKKRAFKLLSRWSDRLQKQITEMEQEYRKLAGKRSYKRLDDLDNQIHKMELEYQEIEKILNYEKSGRADDGNSIQIKHMQILR